MCARGTKSPLSLVGVLATQKYDPLTPLNIYILVLNLLDMQLKQKTIPPNTHDKLKTN